MTRFGERTVTTHIGDITMIINIVMYWSWLRVVLDVGFFFHSLIVLMTKQLDINIVIKYKFVMVNSIGVINNKLWPHQIKLLIKKFSTTLYSFLQFPRILIGFLGRQGILLFLASRQLFCSFLRTPISIHMKFCLGVSMPASIPKVFLLILLLSFGSFSLLKPKTPWNVD